MASSSLNNDLHTLNDFKSYLDTGLDTAASISKDLAQLGDGEDVTLELDQIKRTAEDLVKLKWKTDNFMKAIDKVQNKLYSAEELASVNDILNEAIKKQEEENQKAVEDDEKYKSILEITGRSEQYELTGEQIVDSESGMTMATQRTMPKDLMTLQEIKDPVRNKYCNHVYERKSIAKYIESMSRPDSTARCPYFGCSNARPLRMSDIADYAELRREMESARRQQVQSK